MNIHRVFFSWIPLAIVITGLCVLVHIAVQQNYRQSLNDPQIQMAEDAAYALNNGGVPAAAVPRGAVIDLRLSLAPWIAIYDKEGTPLGSDGVLDNAPPKPPISVFDDLASGIVHGVGWKTFGKESAIAKTRENRLSWQPAAYVRQAIVVVQLDNGGFVVAGRNMREVESREGDLGRMTFIAWLVLLLATLVATAVSEWFRVLQA